MSWLTKVRNSIPFLPKRETPDNLWHKCPECEAMVFTKEYEDNLFVCPRCDHHGRIGPTRRFDMLLDPGYTVLPPPQVKEDPLKFRDSKRYTDRLKSARQQTQTQEWQTLKLEIDSMIEGRIPTDPQKIQQYHELSRHLKGSKPSLNA